MSWEMFKIYFGDGVEKRTGKSEVDLKIFHDQDQLLACLYDWLLAYVKENRLHN